MTLLIVDDFQPLRARIGMTVSALAPDTQIREAASHAEASAALLEFEPGVVVLDIQLPDGNGYDLLRILKRDHASARVFVLSNHPFYRKKCLEAGADHFFDKSEEFDLFAETIARVI